LVVVAQVCGSVIALRFVYVTVGLTLHLVRFGKLIPHVQTAIGDRLRAELEVPRGLTPELSVFGGPITVRLSSLPAALGSAVAF
jgi:hypothetical protein